MFSQRIVRASALRPTSLASRTLLLPIAQRRTFLPVYNAKEIIEKKYPAYPELTDAEDPGMNGGYINPPRTKRQFRDPHGDWWDKQERRNLGEPVHEDNDVLGVFSPFEYTWISSGGQALIQIGAFVATFLSVCWVVSKLYPEKPSYPREFEGGLERELGGAGAVRARAPGDPDPVIVEEEAED